MSSKPYPEEFKIEAVKQLTDRGHSAADVASRLGVSLPTLYEWLKRYGLAEAERSELHRASNHA
jgi:transposase